MEPEEVGASASASTPALQQQQKEEAQPTEPQPPQESPQETTETILPKPEQVVKQEPSATDPTTDTTGIKRPRAEDEEAGGGPEDEGRGWEDDSENSKRAAVDAGGAPSVSLPGAVKMEGGMGEGQLLQPAIPVAHKSYSVTLLVPNDAMGLLIGKGGTVRQQIANESGCKVKVQDYVDLTEGSRERGITLQGPWESIERAQQIVLEKLKHRRSVRDLTAEDGPPLQYVTGEGLQNLQSDEPRALIRWLVPNEMCGLLIGKKGAGIHQINNDSGAKIKVGHEEEMPPGSGERVVYIVGTKAANEKALALIQAKVGGKAAEHAHVDSMVVPLRAIAHLLGPSGNNIKTVREISGAKVHVMNLAETEMGSTESKIGFDGTPEQVALAKEMLNSKLREWEIEARSRGEDIYAEVTTIKMAVPFPLVGHLIGKQGANIKELLKTGALIKILQEEKTHTRTFDERPVLITGPTRTVLEVQKAVCERMMSAPSRVLEQIRMSANTVPSGPMSVTSGSGYMVSSGRGPMAQTTAAAPGCPPLQAHTTSPFPTANPVNAAQVQQAQALLSAYGINLDLSVLAQAQQTNPPTRWTGTQHPAQAVTPQAVTTPYVGDYSSYATGAASVYTGATPFTAPAHHYAAYQAAQAQQAANATAAYLRQQQQQQQQASSTSSSSATSGKPGQPRGYSSYY